MRWLAMAALLAACADNQRIEDQLGKLDQRLVELEDKLDSTERRVAEIGRRLDDDDLSQSMGRGDSLAARLGRIEAQLEKLTSAQRPGSPTPRPTYKRPDPTAVYAVPITGAPFRGARDARVTVVEAFEFACPFCERVRPTMTELLRRYDGKIKIVYKHFVIHPNAATDAAHASCAAGLQGKWEAIEELIWDEGYKAGRRLDAAHIETLARKAGVDMQRFARDRAGDCPTRVRRDRDELSAVGVRGTPAFFVNGRFLSGAQPIDQFARLIDDELAKADDRIAGGTAVADYYRTWVLDRGLPSL